MLSYNEETLFGRFSFFCMCVCFFCVLKVVTWDDTTGSMVPFGNNRTYAREEMEGRSSGMLTFQNKEKIGQRRSIVWPLMCCTDFAYDWWLVVKCFYVHVCERAHLVLKYMWLFSARRSSIGPPAWSTAWPSG